MRGNAFGLHHDVTPAVVTMLERNTTLTSLNLTGCHFETSGHIAIVSALRRNVTLAELKLGKSSCNCYSTMLLDDDPENDTSRYSTVVNPLTFDLLLELQSVTRHDNNAMLSALQVSTEDFSLDSCPDFPPSWSRPSLRKAVRAIESQLQFNASSSQLSGTSMDTDH